MSSSALVRGLAFTHDVSPPRGDRESSVAANVSGLEAEIVRQREHLLGSVDGAPVQHILCTTMIDVPLSTGIVDGLQLVQDSVRHARCERAMLTNAYECAGWGYGLRFYQHTAKRERTLVLITILDVNALELSFWEHSDHWGRSGFGVLSVLLETGADTDPAVVGSCGAGNNLVGFASQVRKHCTNFPDRVLSLPFFPPGMSESLRRALKRNELLPELYDRYGHVFGADPWISLLHELEQPTGGDIREREISVCSLAFRGYFCFLNVRIASDAVFARDERRFLGST